MMIKDIVKKLLYKERTSSQTYIDYMRKNGAKIGQRVTIFSPKTTNIDMTRPWLIDIGNDVQITEGVTILTHGYDWAVLKGVYGEILGSGGGVKVGNNVFIGMKTTILKGVNIGNNVIIGANSVVSGHLEGNHVYAGNPAKKIISIDEFYNKRKKNQLKEAVEFVHCFKERYGHWPEESDLREYFYLFSDGDNLNSDFIFQMQLQRNYNESLEKLKFSNEKPFRSYKEFLEHCKKSMLI